MRIYKDISLNEFEAWSGAEDTMETLRQLENETGEDVFGIVEGCLEGIVGDTDETELNDFLWFETDNIAEWLGYEDWEQLERVANGEDEEEEEEEEIELVYSVGDIVNYNGEKGVITEVDESDKDFPYCVKTDSMEEKQKIYCNGEWCAADELEDWEDEEE